MAVFVVKVVVMMTFRFVFIMIVIPVMIVFRLMVVVVFVADHFDPGAGVDHHDAFARGQRRLADVLVEAGAVLEQQERLAGGGDLHEVVRGQDVVVGASGIRRGQQFDLDPGPVNEFPGKNPDRVCGRGYAVPFLGRGLHRRTDFVGQEEQHGAQRDEREQKSDGEEFHYFGTPLFRSFMINLFERDGTNK